MWRCLLFIQLAIGEVECFVRRIESVKGLVPCRRVTVIEKAPQCYVRGCLSMHNIQTTTMLKSNRSTVSWQP